MLFNPCSLLFFFQAHILYLTAVVVSTCCIHNAIPPYSSFTSEDPSLKLFTELFLVMIKIKTGINKRKFIDFVGHPVNIVICLKFIIHSSYVPQYKIVCEARLPCHDIKTKVISSTHL